MQAAPRVAAFGSRTAGRSPEPQPVTWPAAAGTSAPPPRGSSSEDYLLWSSCPLRRGGKQCQRAVMVPLRKKDLSFTSTAAARRPGELAAIRRRDWKAIEAVRIGHSYGFLPPLKVDH